MGGDNPQFLLLAGLVCLALGQQRPNHSNKIMDVKTTCNKDSLAIELVMERPFKGLVFSKDFSRECRSQGKNEPMVSLHLPSKACGVRTSTLNTTIEDDDDEEDLYYSVELVVQMDRQLQQSTDQEVVVRCKLSPRAVRIKSAALEGVIKTKFKEMYGDNTKKTRMGRTRQGFATPADSDQIWVTESSRAWMELAPSSSNEPDTVEVGQPTTLLIQTTLPVGVGFRVTYCFAHDGLEEVSQRLLDDAGCPIDETIFNRPLLHRHKAKGTEIDITDLEQIDPRRNYEETNSLKQAKNEPENAYKHIMSHQHAVATFAAFKFPDHAKLHLTCGIDLCKGECPAVDCKALQKPQKTRDGLLRKARLDKEAQGVIIDRLEVYNSIKVLAPNIELEDEASIRGSRRTEGEDEIVRRFSPGDKTICLSPGKMALAFSILGVIFLCAIAVAFVSLVRARRRMGRERLHTSLSFYTGSKSIFSSSESSSSGLSGSKMLLTDSPYMDHHSSSSHNNWPYSRGY